MNKMLRSRTHFSLQSQHACDSIACCSVHSAVCDSVHGHHACDSIACCSVQRLCSHHFFLASHHNTAGKGYELTLHSVTTLTTSHNTEGKGYELTLHSVTTLMTSHNTEGKGYELTLHSVTTLMASHNTAGKDSEAIFDTVVESALKHNEDMYGARFPTEIYTRGCHWSPRVFA
jgi:hypothetical protein